MGLGEELDQVARRVLQQGLTSAAPLDDLAAQRGSGALDPVDRRVQVVDADLEAVPATRLR